MVTYKDEENQMKNEGASGVTTLYSYILDAQGQLTLKLGVGSGRKSNSFKLLWMSLLPVRMRKIHSKMKVLEWSQHISHWKSMQIFYDAHGKLTPKSEVGSTLNSNSCKLQWLSLLPTRMKKISRTANPTVQCLNWLNFEPIQAFMVDLVTCKTEEDPIKNEGTKVVTALSISFFKMLKGSSIIGDGILTEFKRIQAFIVFLLICKNEEVQFKIESTRVVTTDLSV